MVADVAESRLFDCDGFGEVARTVDVATTHHRQMIGKQLERNNGEHAL